MNSVEGVEGVDYKICQNCQQRVPTAQMTMHETRCHRINWYCVPCKMVVLKTDRDKHAEQYHANYICEWCGEEMENRLFLEHKKTDCPARNVTCRYCKLMLQYRKMWTHEQSCGAVTEICLKCNNRYPRRELESHEKTCGGTSLPYKAPPRRTFVNNNHNDMMLCEKCQHPFSSFEELQVHIFTDHHTELEEFSGLFGSETGNSATAQESPGSVDSSDSSSTESKKDDKQPISENIPLLSDASESRDDVEHTPEETNIETCFTSITSTTSTTSTTSFTSTTTITTTTVQSQSGVSSWTGIGKTSTTELPSNGKEKKLKLTESNQLEQFEMDSDDE